MSTLSDDLIFAIRSKKQTHFDSVLEDMRQWHQKHGSFVEQEFAQEIVDVFEYTIKSSHRELLNTGIELLSHWIVHCATEEVANKLFDVVNNPWLVRALLTAVDDPRMLEKCNLEDVLYNQIGVIRRKVNADELMLFVKLPAPKCIQYLFSDPFVLKALNQEEQADKHKRLSENDHIFWSLTDPSVKQALPSVLDSLFSHIQTRWVGYYMAAVCNRGSLDAFNILTQHSKFTSMHLQEIETFFAGPIEFPVHCMDLILQMKPELLSLQARSSHISSLIFNKCSEFYLEARLKQLTISSEGLTQTQRIDVLCHSLKKCYKENTMHYSDYSNRNIELLASFDTMTAICNGDDLDGLLHNLPKYILDVVREHPLMQQRILCAEVADLSDTTALVKRKM